MTQDYAEAQDVKVGGKLSLTTPSGEERTLVVRGIYDPPQAKPLLGPVTMTQAGFDEAFRVAKNSFTFIDADAETGTALAGGGQGPRRRDVPHGRRVSEGRHEGAWRRCWRCSTCCSASRSIVSLFGMVNTMVLSVFERTREIGMLRTIGMTRRQARRMIRQESVITALIGAVLGLGLGVFLSALVTKAMSDYDVAFSLPVADAARLHAGGGARRRSARRSCPPAGPRG